MNEIKKEMLENLKRMEELISLQIFQVKDAQKFLERFQNIYRKRLLESGTPINIVSLALGHSDISTTGVYTKASPTDLLKYYKEDKK